MTNFRRGDVMFEYGGTTYVLRLTMGALARIDARLDISGPTALAKKLRSLNCASDAQALLACLLLCPPSVEVGASAAVPDIPPAILMPAIAQLFERTFAARTE